MRGYTRNPNVTIPSRERNNGFLVSLANYRKIRSTHFKTKMGKIKPTNKWIAGGAGVLAAAAMTNAAQAQTSDPLLNTLIKKGVLTQQEAEAIKTEASTNAITAAASKWKINNGIKSIELFGDFRFRYEYRSAEAVDGTGKEVGHLTRDRLPYSVQFVLRCAFLAIFY